MEDARLNKIKRRLGISTDDTNEDTLLNDLVEDAESYFKGLTGAYYIEPQYNFIIENVVYKLYGRKGSEAVVSESVDGYSVTYQDLDDLFKPYMKILDNDFELSSSIREKGKVLFL